MYLNLLAIISIWTATIGSCGSASAWGADPATGGTAAQGAGRAGQGPVQKADQSAVQSLDRREALRGDQREEKTLWDSWYTMTLRGGVPYAVYHEVVKILDSKVQIKTEMTKLEDGFLNTEHYGSLSDAKSLHPLSLNTFWTERSTESRADLEFTGDSVKGRIQQGSAPPRIFQRKIPKDTFLSSAFGVWLSRELKSLKPKARKGFLALQEDFVAGQFNVLRGWVEATAEKPDGSQTRSLVSDYGGARFLWKLDSAGRPLRIERPDIGLVTELTTKEKAEKFLTGSP